jgi:stage V sporulation protein B
LKPTKKHALLSGALVLALAGAVVKIIGLVYKIPLTNLIKSEGMGYFNSAYTIYTFFYMLSTAGLPVAISMLVSQARTLGNRARVKKIFSTASVMFFAVGALGSLAMFFFADFFAKILGNPSAALSIKAISPTLFFVSAISVFRGYFQGHQYMLPTAISQIAEAAGKLGFGIFLATAAINKGFGYEKASAGAAVGLSLGMAVAFLYLAGTAVFFRGEKYYETVYDTLPSGSRRTILKSLIKAALPITFSASVLSMSNTLDLVIVMHALVKAGLSSAAANAAYGNYTALAVPLFNLPIVLITPIASTVVPYIAGAISAGDSKKVSSSVSVSLRTTALIAFPCAMGLCSLSEPILKLLFDNSLAEAAAPLLTLLSPSVIFLSFATVTNALLQSLGRPLVPVFSMFAGAAVKIISCPTFIERFSVKGTPMSTFLCYFTVCAINFVFIYREMKEKPSFFKMFARPLFASLASACGASYAYTKIAVFTGENIACLASIALAAVIYFIIILLTRYLSSEEILMLPRGEKILKIFEKLRLVKSERNLFENERNRDFKKQRRTQN